MAADQAEEVKLQLPQLSGHTMSKLAAKLPRFATVTNPIDLTAALLTDSSLFGDVLSIVAADPATDMLFVGMSVAGEGYDVDGFARDAAAFASNNDKPIVIAAPQDAVADKFRSAGIPTFGNQTEAIRLLAQLVDHIDLMRRPLRPMPSPIERTSNLQVRPGFLSEFDSLAFLKQHGLPTVPCRLCQSEEEACAAAIELGFPVAVKACSPAVPHKSDRGLVMLGLGNEAAVARAFHCVNDRLGRLEIVADGILVAPMVKGRRELMLGARVDPTFGPVVLIGDGGKYVEALGDFTVLMPPLDADDVRRAVMGLRIASILSGVRGEPAIDLKPLAQTAIRLGQIITDGAGTIASIDINPAIVGVDGQSLVIVDALIERVV
jgi:acyl-CoA synthetase (NDP forming)